MKTALQEHIEWLEDTLSLAMEHAPILENCLKLCISDAKHRLEKEKHQIENAYNEGDNNGADRIYYHSDRDDKSAEQYYNETFKLE